MKINFNGEWLPIPSIFKETREERYNYLELQRKQFKKKNRVQTILTFTLIAYIMFSTILNIVLISL